MKKRIISFLCALVLLLGVFPCGTQMHAEEITATPAISVERAWATGGGTVDVKLSVANNPGILGGTFTVSWAEELELVSAKKGDAFDELNYQKPSSYDRIGTNFIWYGESVSEIDDGTFLILTFKVDEEAAGGSMLAVNVVAKQVLNKKNESITVNCVNGGIQVVDYVPGDVNSDSVVDLMDVITLVQYVSDNCTTKPDGYNITLNESAADVNDDGATDLMDVIMICQYVSDGSMTDPNGYNIVLKPSTPRCKHTNIVEVPFKEVTCEEDGNILHYICDDCDKLFNNAEGTVELTEEEVILRSEGHEVIVDEAVAPTHTTTGLTEGSHCGKCGSVLVEQEEVPALAANYHPIIYHNLNGAESPETTQYAEHTGLDPLPTLELEGYKFKGWYTASEGGTIVDRIPKGSKEEVHLYARWELVQYRLVYKEAPDHNNPATYTVEDRVILDEPTWAGLAFTGWVDQNGNEYDDEIPAGTTGNLDLTAQWKLMRNIATPGQNSVMEVKFYEEVGLYSFIFELGTIEHVVLEELTSTSPNTYYHNGAGDFTLSMEQTIEMSNEVATSIARTISKSVSSSSEWESSKEWAEEKSITHSTNESISLEIGKDEWPVKTTIEAGYGYENASGKSWGESTTQGGSYGTETENGEETSSSLAYTETLSTTTSTSITIPKDSPSGYYSYAHVGNIRVFGIVTYNAMDGRVYLNTYSMLDNMHDMLLYYPDINSMNHPTCETLEYRIPVEKIEESLDKAYFVSYDANGGKGTMSKSLHTIGGEEKLLDNAFTREGYVFDGWEERNEDGTVKRIFADDGQVVNDIANRGECVKLYAIWKKADYTIDYTVKAPVGRDLDIQNMPEDAACKFDEDVTLAEAPVLTGYTFDGWYHTDNNGTTKVGEPGQLFEKANFVSENKAVYTLDGSFTPNKYKVTFDLQGGEMSNTEATVIYDEVYGKLPVPTKVGHVFVGWTLPNGVMVDGDTTKMTTAADHTLTAKWLKTKAYIYYRDDTYNPGVPDIRIDDDDAFQTELVNPDFNISELVAANYSRLKITCKFDLCEIDQGNQWIRLMGYHNANDILYEQKFNSTPSGWTSYTVSVTIDLDPNLLSNTCAFYAGYDAWGNGGDDWWLGDTLYTIEALK